MVECRMELGADVVEVRFAGRGDRPSPPRPGRGAAGARPGRPGPGGEVRHARRPPPCGSSPPTRRRRRRLCRPVSGWRWPAGTTTAPSRIWPLRPWGERVVTGAYEQLKDDLGYLQHGRAAEVFAALADQARAEQWSHLR